MPLSCTCPSKGPCACLGSVEVHNPCCAKQDNWHHTEDVIAGFALGLGLAYAFYRQTYPPLSSPKAGEPILPTLEPPSGEGTPQRLRQMDVESVPFTEAQL
jgi:hypothetical protein